MTVTADESRAELLEALAHLNEHAHRQPHVLGVSSPSRWDEAHAKIDALLDALEAATNVRP